MDRLVCGGLWLGFFREHFAASCRCCAAALALYLNWRLAVLPVRAVRGVHVLTTLVVRRPTACKARSRRINSDLSARASTRRNVRWVQSFVAHRCRGAGAAPSSPTSPAVQMPVLSWWRWSPSSQGVDHDHRAGDLHRRHRAATGLTSVRRDREFVSFATMLIQKLEQVVSFINNVFMEAPRLQESSTCWMPCRRPATRSIPGRLSGLVEFKDVSFSYDGNGRRSRAFLTALPGQGGTIALVGRPAPASRRPSRCCIARSIRSRLPSGSTAWMSAA